MARLTVATVQARTFNNPILTGKPYSHPGALKVNGIYYVVTEASGADKGDIAIHTSKDLKSWVTAGYLFDDFTKPTWVGSNRLFTPKIHKIGSNFIVYFASKDNRGIVITSAAIASHPLGPYTPMDKPIQPQKNQPQEYPTIINDKEKLYLVWFRNFSIYARQLNSNGLSYSSDQTFLLLSPSLSWEGGTVYSPWHILRGSYHYLLYTVYGVFSMLRVGVARSKNALGPYEKLSTPILVPNSDYVCTRDVSVVKDLDEKSDIIFFTAHRRNYANEVDSVVLASLGWDDDDWPYVDFQNRERMLNDQMARQERNNEKQISPKERLNDEALMKLQADIKNLKIQNEQRAKEIKEANEKIRRMAENAKPNIVNTQINITQNLLIVSNDGRAFVRDERPNRVTSACTSAIMDDFPSEHSDNEKSVVPFKTNRSSPF